METQPKRIWTEYQTLRQKNPSDDSEIMVNYYAQNSMELVKASNQSNPILNIIIPAYNEGLLIPRTLASINQALKFIGDLGVSVTVVDNNSQDGTARISQAMGAKVITETSKGVGHARQAGLESLPSSSQYVLTTDADTVVGPHWINRHYQQLKKPKTVFTYGGIIFLPDTDIDIKTKLSLAIYTLTANIVHQTKSQMGIWIAGGANMGFHRETSINIGGYNVMLAKGEDSDLMTRMAQQGQVVKVRGTEILTSSRRILHGGVFSHGIKRLQDNLQHAKTGELPTSATYEDVRTANF